MFNSITPIDWKVGEIYRNVELDGTVRYIKILAVGEIKTFVVLFNVVTKYNKLSLVKKLFGKKPTVKKVVVTYGEKTFNKFWYGWNRVDDIVELGNHKVEYIPVHTSTTIQEYNESYENHWIVNQKYNTVACTKKMYYELLAVGEKTLFFRNENGGEFTCIKSKVFKPMKETK